MTSPTYEKCTQLWTGISRCGHDDWILNMSVQFGKCNFDGAPVDQDEMDKVRALLAKYGPDGEGFLRRDNFAILYRAFHTTQESRSEIQPYVSASGPVFTWDGRLDNRTELIHDLGSGLSEDSPDVSIVSAADCKWGVGSFGKLTGDWALSIWTPSEQILLLARDPIGTRHLCYSIERPQVTWSSILDPLLIYAGHSFELNEEYIAGWLSSFPAAHLTPYVGIHAVPPSCFVRIAEGTSSVTKYWDFDPSCEIRYRSDAEYEEHFRSVLAKAVGRRLRSDRPVLAELSGGMDSSSIVCVADALADRGEAATPRIDTISYYADSEPNWNELPYVRKVEEKRGRSGWHVSVGAQGTSRFEVESKGIAVTPDSIVQPSEAWNEFVACLSSQGNRVVLSGIGGDEVTGGVPTPMPELADLLTRARLMALFHQLTLWALHKRKPWLYLFSDVTRSFLPATLAGLPNHAQSIPWLKHGFTSRNGLALAGYVHRLNVPLGAKVWTLQNKYPRDFARKTKRIVERFSPA